MPIDSVQANAKFLADVLTAAHEAATRKPDVALQMKTVRGGVSFRSVAMKTAGNIFNRSANVALRQRLFEALASIEGTKDNAVLLDELRGKLGLPRAEGEKVSNKPLSARLVRDIVNASLVKSSDARLRNELNATWETTVKMPGFRSVKDFHDNSAIPQLTNFACRLVGLNANVETVRTAMNAAMEYISNVTDFKSDEDRFERFAAIARKVPDLVRWEKGARLKLGDMVLAAAKDVKEGLPLGAADALRHFVDAKMEKGMQTVLAEFMKKGSFSTDNAYRSVHDEIKSMLPVFTGIREGTTVGAVVKRAAQQVLREKMPSVERKLKALAQNHPAIADLVQGQGDAMKIRCFKDILTQVAHGVKDWRNTDLEKVTSEVQTRATRMAERLTSALDTLEATLKKAEESLVKGSLKGVIRAAAPDGARLSEAQMLELVRNDESYRYYASEMLNRLQDPKYLDAGRSNKKMVGDAASNAQAAFNTYNSTFNAFLTPDQLARQISGKMVARLNLMNEDFMKAVRADPICKTAFELPQEATQELKTLAKGVQDFCRNKVAEEFKGFLNASGRKDLNKWPTAVVTDRVVKAVKAKIGEPGGFAARYAEELRGMCNTKILNTVSQLHGVADAFKAALPPAFAKVRQDALPDDFRFESKEIESVETDRYGDLNAQAEKVLKKSYDGKADVDLAEIPQVPDIRADVGTAVARAEKAVKVLSEVTREIGSYVRDRKLTWLVSPTYLKLDRANFDATQTDARLTEALKTVKKTVLDAINGGTEPDTMALASHVENTIRELAAAARERMRDDGFVAQLTQHALGALPGDIRSALTPELMEKIRDGVEQTMSFAEGGPVEALRKVHDWFQAGLTKINRLATEAGKSLPSDQMALVLRDPSFVKLKTELLVKEILSDRTGSGGQLIDATTGEPISIETRVTKTLSRKMSNLAALLNETSRKQEQELKALISGLNEAKLKEFGVEKTAGGNWLDGLSLEDVKVLVGVLAQDSLRTRQVAGKVDFGEILQTSVKTLFAPEMRNDMQAIVDYVRKFEQASVGGKIRGLFGKITGGQTEITDTAVKEIVMDSLRKCCEDPAKYRHMYFYHTMTGWQLDTDVFIDDLEKANRPAK